jgi:hypothetical protein
MASLFLTITRPSYNVSFVFFSPPETRTPEFVSRFGEIQTSSLINPNNSNELNIVKTGPRALLEEWVSLRTSNEIGSPFKKLVDDEISKQILITYNIVD